LGDEKFKKIKVLDPSCGTGGFLRTFVHTLSEILYETELIKNKGNEEKAKSKSKDLLKSICDRNVFGIDFNPILVRAAQMNLVMHGDGSSNVFHENTLKSNGEYSDNSRKSLKDESFDLILSNPPFGDDLSIDDGHILDQYELSTFESSNGRSIMAPQELFIERSYRFLKPGGLYAIVTPDNIVSNPNYRYIRHWMLMRFKVIASISLPTEMFQPSTGTQTSLLILKRRKEEFSSLNEVRDKYSEEHVFLSIPHKIGHDLRGNLIPLRDEDGNIVTMKIEKKRMIKTAEGDWREEVIELNEPVPYDLLPKVLSDFKNWFKEFNSEI
jgi:type I restriction enzyme M protein